ncbi:hypothetical protein V2J09_006807 [Rumex salicifolius]
MPSSKIRTNNKHDTQMSTLFLIFPGEKTRKEIGNVPTPTPMDVLEAMKSNLLLPGSNLLFRLSESMPNASCGSSSDDQECRDDSAALRLKLVAIAAILVSSLAGIALPLVGKDRRFLRTDSNLFVTAKAFAAGVILATGFVHMLPDGSSNLTNPCLPEYPWSDFPFSGLFAMASALLTLLADFVGTQVYERKQKARVGPAQTVTVPGDALAAAEGEKVFGEEDGGGMHIVGIRAHAAHHSHSHSQETRGCTARQDDDYIPLARSVDEEEGEGHFGHIHSHAHGGDDGEEDGASRHVVVSQVLELGIVSHSVIIGLSLGVSHSTCTIRPLIAALSFHQFFEGFALGGCISQAQFKTLSTVIMACFFTLTTPAGIAVGIGVASSYNEDSARALIIEGILDCVSAGILIYMALVDLIAADFMSKRMRCNVGLQIVSYFALFFGASLMSLLAVWA